MHRDDMWKNISLGLAGVMLFAAGAGVGLWGEKHRAAKAAPPPKTPEQLAAEKWYVELQRYAQTPDAKQAATMSAKSAASSAALEIARYFVDRDGQVRVEGQRILVGSHQLPFSPKDETALLVATGSASNWCVAVKSAAATDSPIAFRYKAQDGLQEVPPERATPGKACN